MSSDDKWSRLLAGTSSADTSSNNPSRILISAGGMSAPASGAAAGSARHTHARVGDGGEHGDDAHGGDQHTYPGDNHHHHHHNGGGGADDDDDDAAAAAASALTSATASGAAAGAATGTSSVAPPAGNAEDPASSTAQDSAAGAGAADANNKPGYRRSYKACDSCRARKIRCDLGDLDAPSDPPCKRCKRERQECTFTTGVRGNRHGRNGMRGSTGPSRRSLSNQDSKDATPNPDTSAVHSSTPTSLSASAGLLPPPPASAPPLVRMAQQGTVPFSPSSASAGPFSAPPPTSFPLPPALQQDSARTLYGISQRSTGTAPPQHGMASSAYVYAQSGQRVPQARASFEFAAPLPPAPPLATYSVSAPGQPGPLLVGQRPTAPSPSFSAGASPAPQGPSPGGSGPLPVTHMHSQHHPHHGSSPASSSASPAASADSNRQGVSAMPRGRGLKRSNTASSSSLQPVAESASGSATGMTPTGSSIDRAALAQVNLQNSRDALKLLATLAGGAKHNEDERERDRDRSRERGPGARERSRDRIRDRSRDRVRDHSRDRFRDRSRDRTRDHSRDRFRDRSRERSRERSAYLPTPPNLATPHPSTTPVSAPGQPASTGASAPRTSVSLGAVHRMQRPAAAVQPPFHFNALAPSALGEAEALGPGAAATTTSTDHGATVAHRMISASAPSTPRGESGVPRFGALSNQRAVGLSHRSRNGGLAPAAEEEGDELDESEDDLIWPRRMYSRQTTPQRPLRLFTLADFEPVRLKIVKRGEVKMLVEYYFEHIHSFAPHCSEHYASWGPEAISELVEREPILLGAILSIASRYCHSGATNIWPGDRPVVKARNGSTNKSVAGADGNPHPVSWKTHLEISSWTHAKVGRALFDPSLHTIGTVEALLMLSEWSTIDMDAADMMDAPKVPERELGNEDEDDEDVLTDGASSDEEMLDDIDDGTTTAQANQTGPNGTEASASAGQKRKRRASSGGRQKRKLRRRTNFLPKAHLFDAMAWQLISMAARMAEALDIHNEASYYGLDSPSPDSRRNAERRLKVWMRVVHCDTQLSIRLGRRGMTDGALTPAWLEILRSHAFRVLETGPIRLRAPVSIGDARISSRRTKILSEDEQRAREQNLTMMEDRGARDEMNRWVETRAFAELMETVANARDMIHLKSSTTDAILLDDKFEVTLRCIRTSLEAWARWVSARLGNTMAALRLRLEYHETRLYAYGPALDALVQRIGRVRARGAAQANDMLSASENLLIHPAYPFAVEAVGAAQTMIRMLTSELESLRCAPARYFLLIVYASLFLLKASAASSVLLPLPRCLASVQAVINTLLVAGPDRTHLCRRYALLLRKYAKQFILLEVEDNNAKAQTPVVGPGETFSGPLVPQMDSTSQSQAREGGTGATGISASAAPQMYASRQDGSTGSQPQPAPAAVPASAQPGLPTADTWSAAPSVGLTPAFTGLYAPFSSVAGSSTGNVVGGDMLTAYDWMWDDIVNPNFPVANDAVDVDDFLQWLDTAGGAPTSGSSAMGAMLAMNVDQSLPPSQPSQSEPPGPHPRQSIPATSSVPTAHQAALPPQGYQNQSVTAAQHSVITAPISTDRPIVPQRVETGLGMLSAGGSAVPGPAPIINNGDSGGVGVGGNGGSSAGGGAAYLSAQPMDPVGYGANPANFPVTMPLGQSQIATVGQSPEGGDLRKLTSGWFASVMGSINRMS
ncbi:zinc finger transcriptional activator [Tilletia horrida]|nr:zinc finger transcriptional activator [Tilletia horrida]KAK0563876.1 zinc finger transcriptional activator [Tilletia horrida]